MRLDDRPVIEQLLEPTPLAHLYDVQDQAYKWLTDMTWVVPAPERRSAERMLHSVITSLEARL